MLPGNGIGVPKARNSALLHKDMGEKPQLSHGWHEKTPASQLRSTAVIEVDRPARNVTVTISAVEHYTDDGASTRFSLSQIRDSFGYWADVKMPKHTKREFIVVYRYQSTICDSSGSYTLYLNYDQRVYVTLRSPGWPALREDDGILEQIAAFREQKNFTRITRLDREYMRNKDGWHRRPSNNSWKKIRD